MSHTPGPWRKGKAVDSVVTDSIDTEDNEKVFEYYGGHVIAESIFNEDDMNLIIAAPEMKKQLDQLAEVIARNLTAWDTSKDKDQGLLPEVYLSNRVWYERLTGEEYRFHKAIKKFNIE